MVYNRSKIKALFGHDQGHSLGLKLDEHNGFKCHFC
jgi:hypothetical protein